MQTSGKKLLLVLLMLVFRVGKYDMGDRRVTIYEIDYFAVWIIPMLSL